MRAHISRPSWSAKTPYSQSKNGEVSDILNRTFDVTVSGPIIKDRVWFSLGTILTPSQANSYQVLPSSPLAKAPVRVSSNGTNKPIDNLVAAGPGGGYAFASDLLTAKPYTRLETAGYYEAKLTAAISTDHTVEFSMVKSNDELKNRNPYGDGGSATTIRRLEMLGTQTDKAAAWGINYRGVLSSTTSLEARYNRYTSEAVYPQGDPISNGNYLDLWLANPAGSAVQSQTDVGRILGFGITNVPDKRNNSSANVNLKVFRDFAGTNHEFDFGVEYYQSDRGTSRAQGADNQYARVGGAFYNGTTNSWLFPGIIWEGPGINGQSGSGNTGLAPIMYKYLGKDGTTKNTTSSAYINDNVIINNNWGLMVGLRYDKIGVVDTTGQTLASNSDFSPRFQLRWDVLGNSRHLVTFTAAEFGGDFTTGFTDAFIQKADSSWIQYGFSGLPGQPKYSADPANALRWLTYAQVMDPNNYTGLNGATAYGYTDGSKTYKIDGKLRAPMLDELTLGYRRNYAQGNYVRATYVYRVWKDDWAFSQDYALDQMVTLPPPAGSNLKTQMTPSIHVFNSNELHRKYQGLELEWMNRISDIWTMAGNYTYGRLTGNNNGGDQTSSFRDNGIPGYFGNRNWLTGDKASGKGLGLGNETFAPDGPLLMDQTHRARLTLTAELPIGKGKISYSFLMRYDSGNNWSATYAAPMGMPSLAPIPNTTIAVKPATYVKYYGGRGNYTYNDTYGVDFKLAYHVPLGFFKTQLVGDLQVTNLFNQMIQSTYSTVFAGNGTNGSNELFLNPGVTGTANKANGDYWVNGRSFAASIGLRF
jgi:hypothetical protein